MSIPKFYPILDTSSLLKAGYDVVGGAEVLIRAGARILQFRHKAVFDRAAFSLAARIADLCRAAQIPFIMNDRADMAALLEAGLHLGQDDLPPSEARRIVGRDQPIGFSTHNEDQLASAVTQPVDYLALGPIFATLSKADPDPVLGIAELARLRELSSKPLVAIGGVTRQNARAAWDAGADSVAVIGDLLPQPFSIDGLRKRAEEWIELSSK